MVIAEIFGKAVNSGFTSGPAKALEILNFSPESIEQTIKKRKMIVSDEKFDIVIDHKPKMNQLNLYLCEKKWSKKLRKSLRNARDFKSMVVLVGNVVVQKKNLELRIGAFGVSSSDLVKSVIKNKK